MVVATISAGCSDNSAYEATSEACQDGLDNDKNGKVDCDDPGCERFEFCTKKKQQGCGDGVVTAPELCDTAISAGQPGACPTQASCDDGNACTADSVDGYWTCSAACKRTTVTECKGGDGCCPGGCTAANDSDCSASCGNGTLEEKESCDTKIPAGQPGACPTSCDDGNACTVDALQNGGSCSASCSHQAVTSCTAGDGCCPVGCDGTTDADCSPACGNGTLEEKESCDTKIAAGQPGACPTSCSDGNACTLDALMNGGTCGASCGYTPISQCKDGDGCCPSGCDSTSDKDCSASCGNGVLEEKESCDTKIAAGQPGACPTACDDGSACTKDALLNGGTCAASCAFQQVTACSGQSSDGCCPAGCNATTDVDCSATCGNGVLEPKESCDTKIAAGQPGACPTSCSDGNSCTKDTLLNGGTCAATCAFPSITGCSGQSSDGCCPAGCNAATDVDCSATCGNGVVEPKETCDTGISGSCPTSCNDANACTKDVLLNGGTCTASCAYVQITQCSGQVSDGCCPTGCNANTDLDCSPTCGNGVVEPKETCDTGISGSCPTSCSDKNPCTMDVLLNGGTCTASCSFPPITACSLKSDGCCPAGCNANTDADCKPVCGNGVVEPGETCDIKIPAGAVGACPTFCADKNPCTTDTLLNPGTCTAACSFPPITTCSTLKSDGCCPSGCNANTDLDCSPVCGNGVVEKGETCDVKIPPYMKGSCPTSCNDNNVCTTDTLINGGTCTAHCSFVQKTCSGKIKDGCCPAGCTANSDLDCPIP